MKHQVLGVSWMLKKEQSNLMGGCLADEMGLGKVCASDFPFVFGLTTFLIALFEDGPNVSLFQFDLNRKLSACARIACMVMNRSKDKARKTTLILAPTALLDQWKAEIESKTNCDLKVLIYHGTDESRNIQDNFLTLFRCYYRFF